MLSRLGAEIGKNVNLQALLGIRKLLSVLRSEASDVVSLAQDPTNPLIWVAFPATKQIDLNTFDALHSRPSERGTKAAPRFRRSVWAAFTKPFTDGKARVLTLRPVVRYSDVPPEELDELQEKGSFQVDKELIVTAHDDQDVSHYTLSVSEQIRSWAAKHGIEVSALLFEPSASIRLPVSGSSLFQLMKIIDDRDKARISIPLDIVEKLMTTPGRRT